MQPRSDGTQSSPKPTMRRFCTSCVKDEPETAGEPAQAHEIAPGKHAREKRNPGTWPGEGTGRRQLTFFSTSA